MKKIVPLLLSLLLIFSLVPGLGEGEEATPERRSFTFSMSDLRLRQTLEEEITDFAFEGLASEMALIFDENLLQMQNVLSLNKETLLHLTTQLSGGRLFVKLKDVSQVLSANAPDLLEISGEELLQKSAELLDILTQDPADRSYPNAVNDREIWLDLAKSCIDRLSFLSSTKPDEREKLLAADKEEAVFFDDSHVLSAYVRRYDLPTENMEDYRLICSLLHMLADGLYEGSDLAEATLFVDSLGSIRVTVYQDDLDNPVNLRFDLELIPREGDSHTLRLVILNELDDSFALKALWDGETAFTGLAFVKEDYSIISLTFQDTVFSMEHITLSSLLGNSNSYHFRCTRGLNSSALYLKAGVNNDSLELHAQLSIDGDTLLDGVYTGSYVTDGGILSTEGEALLTLTPSKTETDELRFHYAARQIEGAMVSDLSQKPSIELTAISEEDNSSLAAEITGKLAHAAERLLTCPGIASLLLGNED